MASTEVQATESRLIRSITAWPPGEDERAVDLREPVRPEAVRWFDLEGDVAASRAEDLHRLLEAHCPGLTTAMVADLTEPDAEPRGADYGSQIRLASTFAVHPHREEEGGERGKAQNPGVLIFYPVELLAGDGWLITCFHPSRTFVGGARAEEDGPPASAAELLPSVREAWRDRNSPRAGDLGLLVMHELVLSYANAHREVGRWFEDWELQLYVIEKPDPKELEARFLIQQEVLLQLWGAMTVLRNWISSQHRPGVTEQVGKAWLPAADHDLAVRIDKRIDKALEGLARLGQSMRSAFQMLHIQQQEAHREQSERLRRRVELAAAGFLVPTLIVGFWGANTWVPGQQEHWGFWFMLGVLLVLTAVAVSVVLRWQRQHKRETERVQRERERLRETLWQQGLRFRSS